MKVLLIVGLVLALTGGALWGLRAKFPRPHGTVRSPLFWAFPLTLIGWIVSWEAVNRLGSWSAAALALVLIAATFIGLAIGLVVSMLWEPRSPG